MHILSTDSSNEKDRLLQALERETRDCRLLVAYAAGPRARLDPHHTLLSPHLPRHKVPLIIA